MVSHLDTWILTLVIFSPLVGAVLLWLPPRGDDTSVRQSAFFCSLVTLALTIMATFSFYRVAPSTSQGNPAYVLTHHVPWIVGGEPDAGHEEASLDDPFDAVLPGVSVDIAYRVGVDGISIWLLLMTAFLTPLAIWASFSGIRTRVREYYTLMLLLQVGMLGVFCALDLLLFYVFFEFTLAPLYFLIGIWGGPERRWAANKFFVYTLAGSVLTFAGVVYLAYYSWTLSPTGRLTLNIEELTQLARFMPYELQWWLFLAFAAGFAVRVPLFPFHTWLPPAHTEAPAPASALLAGVLLKLGAYGFLRVSLPMLSAAASAFAPIMAAFAIQGTINAALLPWAQGDCK